MTMKTKKTLQHIAAVAVVLLTLCLVFSAAVAAEGATPTYVEVGDYTNLSNNLTAGNSVKLTADIEIAADNALTVSSGNVFLNLDGHSIIAAENESLITINGGNLTIEGTGTISASDYTILVKNGNLTINSGVTLNATILKDSDPWGAIIQIVRSDSPDRISHVVLSEGSVLEDGLYGISLAGIDTNQENNATGVTVDVYGKILTSAGIYINGYYKDYTNYPTINLYSTANITASGAIIYAAGYAKWNFNGGTYVGGSEGLSIKAGDFTISGGSFTSNGQYFEPAEGNGNGSEPTGAALSITSDPSYAQRTNVSVSGGIFTSKNGHAVYEGIALNKDTGNWMAESSYVQLFSITGGKFITKNESLDVVNLVNMSAELKGTAFTGGEFNKELGNEYFAINYKLGYKDGFYVLEKNEITVTVINLNNASDVTDFQIPVNSKYCFTDEKTGYICKVYQDAEKEQAYPADGLQLSADTTLYYEFVPIIYTIVFDANAGGDDEEATGEMASIQATYDEPYILPELNFSIEGKVFAGWATSTDGPALYFDTVAVMNLADTADDTVTLHAIWTTIEDVQPREVSVETTATGATKVSTSAEGWNNASEIDAEAPVTLTNKGVTMVILFDEEGWTYENNNFVGNITNVTVTYPNGAASLMGAGTIMQNVSFVLDNATSVLPKINATYDETIALAINATANDLQVILPLAMITAENADEVNANLTKGDAVTVTFILNKASFAAIGGETEEDITLTMMQSMLKGYHYVSETKKINPLDVTVTDDEDEWIVTMTGEHFSSYALALYMEEEAGEEDTPANNQQSAVIISPSKSNKDVVDDPTEEPTEEPTDEPTDVPGEDLPEIPGAEQPETPATPAPVLAVLAALGAAAVIRRK